MVKPEDFFAQAPHKPSVVDLEPKTRGKTS